MLQATASKRDAPSESILAQIVAQLATTERGHLTSLTTVETASTFGWQSATVPRQKARKSLYKKLYSAFTLLELLVVMGIIAVLAAILTSGLIYGLNSSKNSACQSNLHQIQMAMSMYEVDHEYYPPQAFCDFSGTFVEAFVQVKAELKPYLRSDSIYQCPADPYFGKVNPYYGEVMPTSYSESLNAFGQGTRINTPVNDVMLYLFQDSNVANPSSCLFLYDYGYGPPEDHWMGRLTAHGDGFNKVDLDGHTTRNRMPRSVGELKDVCKKA